MTSESERRQAYEDEHGWGSSDAKQPETTPTCEYECGCDEIAATAWIEDGSDEGKAILMSVCSECLHILDEQDRVIKVIERKGA